ncbi:transcriptional regulator [Paralcaligenes sp. KSB-10]|uniref:PhaM family polyhydroxyalkanoate granule multifunctional regulatory protein n=1 Tax=Paralcaligenes sp. KSB-10 TaxID=2901142 RepID=UPI001E2F8F80|nr:PhaM family polyhydroxyalkanoate granule multifunctional regulatory protein [Paralcaligenes sp. KSB-10]UHL63798.1 transcriptional regulator [Paralcaligenes sp. KSB-10]
MTTQNSNPFVLPGLGQSGDLGKNPLMASLEMMRQAWQGMSGPGGLSQSAMAAPASLDDLDRRIADLQTVENWLRMNLSMLSSTIQGMEVQRATIATLKTFMNAGGVGVASAQGPSPLEVALGLKPAGASAAQAPAAEKDKPAAAPQAQADSAKSEPGAQADQPDLAAIQSSTQGWWNMLQKQFDSLAAATAATMQGAEAAAAQAGASAASPDSTAHRPAAKKTAAKPAGSSPRAPRKRAAAARKANP